MEESTNNSKNLSLGAQVYLKKRWPGETDRDQLLLEVEKELKSVCWTPFSDHESVKVDLVAPKKARSSKVMGLIFVLFGLCCLFIVPSAVMRSVYLLFFGVMGVLMFKRGTSVLYLLEVYHKFKR